MKKIFFSAFCLTLVCLLSSTVVQAASPTPTPKASAIPKASASPKLIQLNSPDPSDLPSPTPSPASDQDTAQKLKDLIKQGTERVKGAMDQNGVQQRGFIGEVQRVTDKTVTVKNLKDTNEILTVDGSVVLTRDNKKATIDDLAIGDWAIAMGTTDKDVFTLKKLAISSTTLLPKTFVTELGTVKTIGKTSLTATARNSTELTTYTINKSTLFQDSQGNKVEVKTIKPDFQYLLVGTKDDTGITLTTLRTLGN